MELLSKVIWLYIFTSQTAICYRLHTALGSIVFTDIPHSKNPFHSEYYFGKCAHSYKVLVIHHKWTYPEIKGKLVVRAWIDVPEEPTCVRIRARSAFADVLRYHPFKFNVCICRLVYNHAAYIIKFFYYEWLIPVEMMPNVEWDLMFYKG